MGGAGEVWVGVTGHRDLARPDEVASQVDEVLERLAGSSPNPIVVVSGLAEGADRLVAHQALARPGGRLVALLPLAVEDYRTDFETAESNREFTELLAAADQVEVIEPTAIDDGSREAAYERAGRAMLDRCDALVALWDGQPGKGRGGTAETVSEARDLGRRVEVITVERA